MKYPVRFFELPFLQAVQIEIRLNRLQTPEEATFLQYRLLCEPGVLYGHVEHRLQRMYLVYNPGQISASKIMQLVQFNEPVLVLETVVSYSRLVANHFHAENPWETST